MLADAFATLFKVSAAEPENIDPATLDLLLSLSKDAPEDQLRAVDALDAKIVQVFAAGTVLIGLPAVRGTPHHAALAVLFSSAVAAFLTLAYFAISALWSRRYRVLTTPDQLWNRFWDESPTAIKHAVVADLAAAYAENDFRLHEKRRALGRALIAVGVEAAVIGTALALSAA